MLENRIAKMWDLRNQGFSLARTAEKLNLSKRTIRTWDAYVNTYVRHSGELAIKLLLNLKEEKTLELLEQESIKAEKRQNYLLAKRGWHKQSLIKDY